MGQRARAIKLIQSSGRTPASPLAEPAPGFLPSRHGFAFPNSWPAAPAISVRIPAGRLGIGNAALGLCGGMVFAALDYWHAGKLPPSDQPGPGSPLYRFIVRRLINSWHIPAGVAGYYRGMVSSDAALASRTISRQWPRVRALLDAGQPAPLGLVTVASASPLPLGHNHQVLAYGYALRGAEVTLAVYDPNSGPSDSVAIRFSTQGATAGTRFAHTVNIRWPVRGFFLTRYLPSRPPPD